MRSTSRFAAAVAVLVLLAGLPSLALAGDRERPALSRERPLTGLIGLRVDPDGSVVQLIRSSDRNLIDPRLDLVSVVCTNCGSGCPPVARTVEVVLQANTAIAAGYGVSNLTTIAYTVTGVTQSTSAALAVGNQVKITFNGDVLDCGTWFSVWFSMCDVAPLHPEDACRTFTLLYEFAGLADNGAYPWGDLTLSGSNLYGMTSAGGDADQGVIFSIATDGSGFTLLHEFAGGGNDGRKPWGSITLSGSTLYGMTFQGGDSDIGVVFSLESNGSGYTLLREFAGGDSDGGYPCGGLTLFGSTLYGMARTGGDSNIGAIFSMATNGSGFTLLHEFAGGGSDGRLPFASLTLSGSTLYGMTEYGGDIDHGVLFSIGTDGSGFTLLHEFAGGSNDGAYPRGSLALSGSTLYGMTLYGGDSDHGVLFSIGTDGSGYSLLHEFLGGANDGASPYGSLALSGTTVSGMASQGGNSNRGVVFSIATDGSGYALLHEFAGGGSDGMNPWYDAPVADGSTLYGMTLYGGDTDIGVIFKLE